MRASNVLARLGSMVPGSLARATVIVPPPPPPEAPGVAPGVEQAASATAPTTTRPRLRRVRIAAPWGSRGRWGGDLRPNVASDNAPPYGRMTNAGHGVFDICRT